ncbi:MAG: magnesium transporter CorA family protein [Aggregatilineales bacterium]
MDIIFYKDGHVEPLTADQLPDYLGRNEGALWVDMLGPTEADIAVMRDLFCFHPLTIEDVCNKEQRPKAEEFTDYLFVILNPVNAEGYTFRELDVFVGKNFLVTVHHLPEPEVVAARKRIEPSRVHFPISATYLMYIMMDTVIDSYLPMLEAIDHEIDSLGEAMIHKPDKAMQMRLFQLKTALNDIWWTILPQKDIMNVLTHHQLVFIDKRSQYYLRDISDHLLRVMDIVQSSRDSVNGLINLYVSAVSNQLNVAVNRLTLFTIVIGVMAVIGGFYGMNFEHTWPPFDVAWGVPFVIVLMISSTAALYYLLQRRR